jgi:predicted DNA-binding transcriptional regulator AlpA
MLTSEERRTRQTLTQTEVQKIVGVSRVTLGRWVAAGKFPKPLPTLKMKIWSVRTVERFLNGEL